MQADEYYSWTTESCVVQGRTLVWATKPGLAFFGRRDPAASLLAERIDTKGAIRIADFHCGPGVVGISAAVREPLASVTLVDRSIVAVEAARRSIALNNLNNASVHFGNGKHFTPQLLDVDVVAIRLPKGKLPILQLMWDAFSVLRLDGRCYIAGANDEGIKSSLLRLEELFGNTTVLGYDSGCRVAVATKCSAVPENKNSFEVGNLDHGVFNTFDIELRGLRLTVCSRPGVFAWDRLDEGSRLLMQHMDIPPEAAILDLGCGSGVIGLMAAQMEPRGHVHLIDADFEALRSATETAARNHVSNCTILAGDACAPVNQRSFDLILTNPPFHSAHRAELSMAEQFIRGAALMLKPGGQLLLVANITLPYERIFKHQFAQFSCVSNDKRYKVLKAWAPRL